jgi:hypothetical protein
MDIRGNLPQKNKVGYLEIVHFDSIEYRRVNLVISANYAAHLTSYRPT